MQSPWWGVLVAVVSAFITYWILPDNSDLENIRGKKVIVTGASRGLGEQLAYEYAKLGADVLITARTESRLQQVTAHCKEVGPSTSQFHYHVTDMSDLSQADSFIQAAERKLGGLDILVLNHILAHPMGPWLGTADNHSHLDLVMDVNMKSYLHLTSHALPLLERSHGQILVINSISGKIGQPFTSAYSATKAAIGAFFDSLRQELIMRQTNICKIGQPFTSAYSATKAAIGAFFDSLRQELIMRQSNISVTQVVLGLIGTETAIQNLRNYKLDRIVDFLQPANPTHAATTIIRQSSLRPWELYYPYWECVSLCMVRDIIPKLLARLHRFFYS